ncbi:MULTISPECIES: DUF3127 domain-containing protein [Flavobacterium]|uniref:DUF3127 domain-containing protein n=1 Tax=Flavobacterium keumense TaxID=1306518 RepID=A0ABY8N653_9FLAO|nr:MULTISPECIES: DUF3127 domain-containing protein [Flavobacterium]WGK93777.1 DUF3127 domain-containing protein [Flavobacterium keumense]
MEITGVIKLIKPTQQVSANFVKREFVIETNDQYPQSILLELHQDRVDIIDSFTEGQEVTCSLNLRGRMWTSPQGEEKYFNTIICWKIMVPNNESVNNTQTQANPQEYPQAPKDSPFGLNPSLPSNTSVAEFNELEKDDLPF